MYNRFSVRKEYGMESLFFEIEDVWCYGEQKWLRPEVALACREQNRDVSGNLSDRCHRCNNCKLVEYQKRPFIMVAVI